MERNPRQSSGEQGPQKLLSMVLVKLPHLLSVCPALPCTQARPAPCCCCYWDTWLIAQGNRAAKCDVVCGTVICAQEKTGDKLGGGRPTVTSLSWPPRRPTADVWGHKEASCMNCWGAGALVPEGRELKGCGVWS